jgi:hypothetical protein
MVCTHVQLESHQTENREASRRSTARSMHEAPAKLDMAAQLKPWDTRTSFTKPRRQLLVGLLAARRPRAIHQVPSRTTHAGPPLHPLATGRMHPIHFKAR